MTIEPKQSQRFIRAMHVANILVLVACLVGSARAFEPRTMEVFGKIRSGFKLAGKFFGIDVDRSKGIAELVSETFGKSGKNSKGDDADAGNNIFSGFLRMMGFDAKKIGAVAINAIIFVAQLISSSLTKPIAKITGSDKIINSSPLDLMLQRQEIQSIIPAIQGEHLSEELVEYVRERSLDEETDCVQLLICRSTPFIKGMQQTLLNINQTKITGLKSLFNFLPSLKDYLDSSERCKKLHPNCFLDMLTL